MLNLYKQFRDFSTFKKFKELLADWWNLDVLIVVKKGPKLFCENSNSVHNPVVKLLLKSEVFKNYFFNSLKPIMKLSPKGFVTPQFLEWKQTGLDVFAAPLNFKNKAESDNSQAFLVAVGFFPKRDKEFKQALSYLSLSDKAIEQKLSSLKKLSSTDEIYIQKMLKILAEEFLTAFQKQKETSVEPKVNVKDSIRAYGYMMGQSPAMQYIFNVLNKIKSYDGCVLIEGEQGTGKRLLAKTIHLESLRANKSFHVQNFSTFKGSFLESALFGKYKDTVKALKHRESLVQKLQGGTLLLNEIGQTSLDFQEQVLKFLKTSVFFEEGELKNKKYNVRIMASTSQDLKKLVKEGEFNEKLYFALNAMNITIPPLKYRKMDIPLLVKYFLNSSNSASHFAFSNTALKLFYEYSWPGNIQELKTEVERILSLKTKDQTVFTENDISAHIRDSSQELNSMFVNRKQNLKETLRSVEKQIMLESLKKNNWNKSKTAKSLGTSRTSLVAKAREYGLLKKGA